MSGVKGRRENGRPSLRQERAAVTRRRIADAALTLFSARGYGATTLAAVAMEAGVAVQTVYAVYGSKAGILRALRERVVSHPEADALFEDALAARDAGRKLELFARSIRRRWEDGLDIVAIHADAARIDPALHDEVEQVLGRRRAGIARLGRSLEHALPGSLDIARATAILDALTLPEIYVELVEIQRWTPEEFEAWLANSLRQQLLRP